MYVIRTGSYGTTPGETPHAVRKTWDNPPVLIGGISVSPAIGHSGIFQFFNKLQPTVSNKIGDTQNLDTSVDRNFIND